MSLNSTPASERVHIGFFGCTNAGKSSVVNRITGQSLSVVSEVHGTTTDPVFKAMELLPVGPVEIIDTPGFNDNSILGDLRIKKTNEILTRTDIAVLVVDATKGKCPTDNELIHLFENKKIPYITVFNKCDLLNDIPEDSETQFWFSAISGNKTYALKETIAKIANVAVNEKTIMEGLVSRGDIVVLVIPIDKAAPKGRLILPQQQVIRDLLDKGAIPVVTRESELDETLKLLKQKPCLVVTDSQVFGIVSKIVPESIKMTSFSILFARYKGELNDLLNGISVLNSLQDGDKILISEGCTHHRQCGDIGTEKIPKWLQCFTGKKLVFEFSSGHGFSDDITQYALVIHCGGCMLNEKEMKSRIQYAKEQGIAITNYGMAIAQFNGILHRSISPILELSE